MPSAQCDHLVLIAPELAEGVRYAQECLGVPLPYGGRHPEMGTHNHVLRIGDDLFLEVIAVDPQAPAPARARWFGLDAHADVRRAWDQGLRLRGWVARTGDLDGMAAAGTGFYDDIVSVSRGERRWRFLLPHDGSLPAGGALPCVIDWGPKGTPAPAMADAGVRLLAFTLEHPEPDALQALHERLGLQGGPEVRAGSALRLRARLATPDGTAELC